VDRSLAVAIAQSSRVSIQGDFERHVNEKYRTVAGSPAGGRWGPPGTYPVIYLGRPTVSVVVEAYRNLVEKVEGMRPELVGPRRLLTCRVSVHDILDLREAANLRRVGLTEEALLGEWRPCQEVGRAVHQLGLHGIIAPAATGLGETLALFEQYLDVNELPTVIAETLWPQLPPDPRQLRLVQGE
jgi:RES domain-containing protein